MTESVARILGEPVHRTYAGQQVAVSELELGGERAVLLVLHADATFGEVRAVTDQASRDYPGTRIFAHAGEIDPDGMTLDELREIGLERLKNGFYL